MVARHAEATLQGVAYDAPPGISRNGELQGDAVGGQMLVQVEESNPGLEDAVAQLRVDLENPLEPAQIDDDRAGHARRRSAIAEILAARDRPQRNPVFVGEAHQRLNLARRAWRDGRGGSVCRGISWGVHIQVRLPVLIRSEHPLFADHLLECGQRAVECR